MGRAKSYHIYKKGIVSDRETYKEQEIYTSNQLNEVENLLSTSFENKGKFFEIFNLFQNSANEPSPSKPVKVTSGKSWLFAKTVKESLYEFMKKSKCHKEMSNKQNVGQKISDEEDTTWQKPNDRDQDTDCDKPIQSVKGLLPHPFNDTPLLLTHNNECLERSSNNQRIGQNKQQKCEDHSYSPNEQLSNEEEKKKKKCMKTKSTLVFGVLHLTKKFIQSKNFETNIIAPTDQNMESTLSTFKKKLKQCCNKSQTKCKLKLSPDSKFRIFSNHPANEIEKESQHFQKNNKNALIAFNNKVECLDERKKAMNEQNIEQKSENVKFEPFSVTPTNLTPIISEAERVESVKSKTYLEIFEENCKKNMYLISLKTSTDMNDKQTLAVETSNEPNERPTIMDVQKKKQDLNVPSFNQASTKRNFDTKFDIPNFIAKETVTVTKSSERDTWISTKPFNVAKPNKAFESQMRDTKIASSVESNNTSLRVNLKNKCNNNNVAESTKAFESQESDTRNVSSVENDESSLEINLENNFIFSRPTENSSTIAKRGYVVESSEIFESQESETKIVSSVEVDKFSLRVNLVNNCILSRPTENNWIFAKPFNVVEPSETFGSKESDTRIVSSVERDKFSLGVKLQNNFIPFAPIENNWIFAKPLNVVEPSETFGSEGSDTRIVSSVERDKFSLGVNIENNCIFSRPTEENWVFAKPLNVVEPSETFGSQESDTRNVSFVKSDKSLPKVNRKIDFIFSRPLIVGNPSQALELKQNFTIKTPTNLNQIFSSVNLFPTIPMSRQAHELINLDLRNIDVRLLTYKEFSIVTISSKNIGDTKLPLKVRQRLDLEQKRHAERFEWVNTNRFGVLWRSNFAGE